MEPNPDYTFDTAADTPATGTPMPGPLDLLSAELDAVVPVPSIIVAVDSRPGWAVRYRTNVSWPELQAWRKRARQGKQIDDQLLSRLILANTCLGFLKDGVDVVDDTGEALTFGSVARRQDITVADAVKVWLVTDGAASGTSDLVYQRSGYRMPDEVDVDADPTRA